MRTLELLNVLSKKELNEVGEIVSGKKKKSLHRLYRGLVKLKDKNREPSNEQLFEQTFGAAYSRQKDYLLRNELRLLNDIIYNYLLVETFNQHIRKHPCNYNQWLLKSFFERDLKSFFEGEIDKSIAQAKNDVKAEEAAVLLGLKGLWQIKYQLRSAENLEQQLVLAKECMYEEERRFLYRIREMEARQAFIQSMINYVSNKQNREISDERTSAQTAFNLEKTEQNDWLARYLLLKKHSYQTKNEVRIEVLKQMLEIEEAPYFKGDFTFNAQVTTLTNLALEYIFLERPEEADGFLEECVKRCEARQHEIPIGNIQNYIANQVVLKRYKKGIEIFKKFEKKITKSRSAVNISILAGFCYLFLNQPDEAIALIQPSAKMVPENQVISRLIYAIAFFLRGDYNLAYNECINLKRSAGVDNVEQKNDIYISIIGWLSRFFAAHVKTKSAKQKDLLALKNILAEQQSVISPHLKKEFALLWLITQANR